MGYSTSLNIDAIGNRSIKLRTNDTDRLSISGAGVATFSNSVTVNQNLTLPSGYINLAATQKL